MKFAVLTLLGLVKSNDFQIPQIDIDDVKIKASMDDFE